MKFSLFSRIVLALAAGGMALMVSGCQSGSGSIAPNWYDSYYEKAGTLAFPNVPDTYTIASPSNPSNQ